VTVLTEAAPDQVRGAWEREWTRHVRWLRDTFGDQSFTCAQVRASMALDHGSVPPPQMADLTSNRKLGQAYARYAGQLPGGVRLVKAPMGRHGHVGAWLAVINS
jgi:hypothetical protein